MRKIFIFRKKTQKTLNGDTVECEKISNREAKIVKIIKRKKTNM